MKEALREFDRVCAMIDGPDSHRRTVAEIIGFVNTYRREIGSALAAADVPPLDPATDPLTHAGRELVESLLEWQGATYGNEPDSRAMFVADIRRIEVEAAATPTPDDRDREVGRIAAAAAQKAGRQKLTPLENAAFLVEAFRGGDPGSPAMTCASAVAILTELRDALYDAGLRASGGNE